MPRTPIPKGTRLTTDREHAGDTVDDEPVNAAETWLQREHPERFS